MGVKHFFDCNTWYDASICNKIPSVGNLCVKIEIEFHYWPIFPYNIIWLKSPKEKIHFLFPPLNIWCSINKYFLPGKALRNWIIFSFSCQFSSPFKIVKMRYQQFWGWQKVLSQHKSHNIFYQFKHSLMNFRPKQYFNLRVSSFARGLLRIFITYVDETLQKLLLQLVISAIPAQPNLLVAPIKKQKLVIKLACLFIFPLISVCDLLISYNFKSRSFRGIFYFPVEWSFKFQCCFTFG